MVIVLKEWRTQDREATQNSQGQAPFEGLSSCKVTLRNHCVDLWKWSLSDRRPQDTGDAQTSRCLPRTATGTERSQSKRQIICAAVGRAGVMGRWNSLSSDLDVGHRDVGFGVCLPGFVSCFGPTIICYAPILPFYNQNVCSEPLILEVCGARELTQQLKKHWLLFRRTEVQFSAPTRQLTQSVTLVPRGSYTLRHTCRQNTNAHKVCINK